jgi:hypothetical protein
MPHYKTNNVDKEWCALQLEESMAKAGKVFNKRVVHIGKANISKEWAH